MKPISHSGKTAELCTQGAKRAFFFFPPLAYMKRSERKFVFFSPFFKVLKAPKITGFDIFQFDTFVKSTSATLFNYSINSHLG